LFGPNESVAVFFCFCVKLSGRTSVCRTDTRLQHLNLKEMLTTVKRYYVIYASAGGIFYRAALNAMASLVERNASVSLSVKRVDYGKTEKKSVRFYTIQNII